MSCRAASSPRSMAKAALQREHVVARATIGNLALSVEIPAKLELQAGPAGVTHLVDANTGERLGCAIDATVLERTRLFFR